MQKHQSPNGRRFASPKLFQQCGGISQRFGASIAACLLVGAISLVTIVYVAHAPRATAPLPIAAAEAMPDSLERPAPSPHGEITSTEPKRTFAAVAGATQQLPKETTASAAAGSLTPANFGRSHAGIPGSATSETRADIDEMRKAGRATLRRELAAHGAKPVPMLQAKLAQPSMSKPLALAPLPTEPPPAIREAMQPAGAQTDCCPGALPPLPELGKDEEPGNVERRQLSVAAQQVGKGDWKAAHTLYREIAATTKDELVRMALRRNLEVTEKQLDIQNEPDPSRREWLELDLARVHQDLGHSFAAQRMWRDLEKRALHPDIRAQSARLRLDPPKPTRPVTLPAVQPQPEVAP